MSVLSAGVGSHSAEDALAMALGFPGVATVTAMAAEALAPLATVPRLQVTVPDASEQVPWLGVAETKTAPAGSTSVSVTSVAASGPPLAAVAVR